MHVLQVIWSRYESTDVSAVNPMRFTVFVFHLNHQTVRFGDLKVTYPRQVRQVGCCGLRAVE